MIPLVGSRAELVAQRKIVEQVARETMVAYGVKVRYLIGTMIELPRACLLADEIAEQAEFFSFGTNDLTQTCLGLSRDDAGKFLPTYVVDGLLPEDPFVSLDQEGVGELMRIAITKGRKVRRKLEIGICGEHGGDPKSVGFCHDIGLDYVSCSPFRVPIAKLAAAQQARCRAQHQAMAAKIKSEVEAAIANLEEIRRELLDVDRLRSGPADRALQRAQNALRAGRADQIDVFDAEARLLTIHDRWLERRLHYVDLESQLEAALGAPLSATDKTVITTTNSLDSTYHP
jgi:signal transduction protein with GAF and PtsI domain